jgi:hypothetical protein
MTPARRWPVCGSPHEVYFDYRLYAPDTPGWTMETSYDLLSYNYVQERDYDVLLLQQQRIADYLNPSTAGIDTQQFANSQAFYATRSAVNCRASGCSIATKPGWCLYGIPFR